MVMLQPKKPRNSSRLAKIPSGDGLMKDSFQASELQEASDSITLVNILRIKGSHPVQEAKDVQQEKEAMKKVKKKKSVTAESPHKDRRATLSDKSLICETSIPTTESSQISVLESTSRDVVSGPSWSCQAREWSPKLWLPTETGSAGSHSNWLSGSFSSMESNSWFSIKKWTPQETPSLQKTSWPSLTFSTVELTDAESTKQMEKKELKESKKKSAEKKKKKEVSRKKPPANCCKKVRLNPPPEVASKLKQWFGAVRHTYNWALGCIKKKPSEYKASNAIWLRKRFVNKCNIPKSKQFLLETPKHVRDSAIEDLAMAFKTNFQKGGNFDVKFRSKKDGEQSITIPYDAIKNWDRNNGELKMYPTFLEKKIIQHTRSNSQKRKDKVPERIEYDCKLLLDKLGRFYLVIAFHSPSSVSTHPTHGKKSLESLESEDACENQAGIFSRVEESKWCSIDPGVRTFLTVYSPTPGECFKIGDGDISRIYRLCKHLDNLTASQNKNKETKKQKRREKGRAILRLRNRIRNLVDEVHKKAVNFLVTRFKNIIIPPFNVKQMIRRVDRKINSQTVRKMVSWSHYRFRQRLQVKAALLEYLSMCSEKSTLPRHVPTVRMSSITWEVPRFTTVRVVD